MVENEVIVGDLIIPAVNSPEFIQIIDEIDINPITGEYIWKTRVIIDEIDTNPITGEYIWKTRDFPSSKN